MDQTRIPLVICDADNLARSALEILFSDENRFEIICSAQEPERLSYSKVEAVVLVDPIMRRPFEPGSLVTARSKLPFGKLIVYTTDFSLDLLSALEDGVGTRTGFLEIKGLLVMATESHLEPKEARR
jgi:hypothetical protein